MLGILREPFSCDHVLEQHHPPAAIEYDFDITAHDRLTPPLVIHSPNLADRFHTFPVSRFPFHDCGHPILIELNLHPLWHVDRSESICFHNPQSAIRNPQLLLRFIVDQRVPPLGETRPWLHLDDVVQHRPFDPQRDLPPGASRGARITREQLQLRGTRCESGELDDQPLHRSGGRRTLELCLERRRDALPRRGWVFEGRGHEPGGAVLELGAHPNDLHAPSAAARISERAVDELVQCVCEQVPLADRSEKREGGHDRLGRYPPHHRLRHEPCREPPQPPAGAAELRHDGFLRKRHERAQRLDAELQQPAMRVGVEREHGERLRGEELRLPYHRHYYRFSWLCARCGHPGDELSVAPPHPERGTRKWERGTGERTFLICSAFRVPHSAFYHLHNLIRPSIQSFQSIGAHVRPPQLHGLNNGAHGDERRDEPRKLLVVMHRVGLAQLERWTESDRLAHGHPRLHARAPGERRDLPHPGGTGGVGGDER